MKDDSHEGVKVAVFAAVQSAVKGAVAMDLSRVTLNAVRVLPQMVIVRVLATDAGADPEASDPEQEISLPSNGAKPSKNELDKSALKIVEGGCHGAL